MCPRPLPGDAGAKPAADDRSEPGESAENAAARATNLRVAYAFTLLAGVARGVWSYSVLSGYLYVLTGIRTSSTHRGERRAAATTRKFVLTLAATCAGPLIAIALFEGFATCATSGRRTTPPTTTRRGRGKPREAFGAPRYVILASDLVSGFGSGMTVKFVPLFFKNRVGFSPVATNALYVASPLFMMAGSRACGRLSREALGRPRACAYFMGLAALGLVGLSLLDSSTADGLGAGFPREPDRGAPGRPLASAKMRAAAVGLYLLTNAQHMCRPLKKSALMDHVPYGDRGKWNAVDGVTRFGWSGSAVLGGYLVDRGGYALTFLITAGMQLLAAALWLALVGVVDPSALALRARARATRRRTTSPTPAATTARQRRAPRATRRRGPRRAAPRAAGSARWAASATGLRARRSDPQSESSPDAGMPV
ncbi:major facilitator superfamily-like protein [Aureococcus anophagefferens]|nr:major facilitator superfamily-like protein [Aureococcus anophagefferens]